MYFSHGSFNSCGVLITSCGNQDIAVNKLWFLLINIYNANTKKEQVRVLDKLTTIISNFENIGNHVIFTDDFNIFFDTSLDAKGGTLTLKKVDLLINW